MKLKHEIPTFKSESEEAEWWFKNRARLDKDLAEAAKKSERLDQETLKARLAASKSAKWPRPNRQSQRITTFQLP
jgi:hypothetical protein